MDYISFCSKIRFSISLNSLKYKYEYKIKSNEFSLYQLLADDVYLFALDLGLNYKLCEALAYVHGFQFCNYGKAGWNIINQYLNMKNYEIKVDELKSKIVKRKVRDLNFEVDDEFYKFIDEMFSEYSKTKEVLIVKECYRIIKTLQPIKNYNMQLFYDLKEKAIKELKELALKNNTIISIDLSKYIPLDIPSFESCLDVKTKQEYIIELNECFHEYFRKYPDNSDEENIIIAVSCFINV